MLKDVNDTPEDARRLVRLLAGIKGKVNLLPLNEAAGIPFERPSDAAVNRFARILSERGVTVSVRKSRGRDIRAACGQLITESSRDAAPGRRLAMAMGSPVASRLVAVRGPLVRRPPAVARSRRGFRLQPEVPAATTTALAVSVTRTRTRSLRFNPAGILTFR